MWEELEELSNEDLRKAISFSINGQSGQSKAPQAGDMRTYSVHVQFPGRPSSEFLALESPPLHVSFSTVTGIGSGFKATSVHKNKYKVYGNADFTDAQKLRDPTYEIRATRFLKLCARINGIAKMWYWNAEKEQPSDTRFKCKRNLKNAELSEERALEKWDEKWTWWHHGPGVRNGKPFEGDKWEGSTARVNFDVFKLKPYTATPPYDPKNPADENVIFTVAEREELIYDLKIKSNAHYQKMYFSDLVGFVEDRPEYMTHTPSKERDADGRPKKYERVPKQVSYQVRGKTMERKLVDSPDFSALDGRDAVVQVRVSFRLLDKPDSKDPILMFKMVCNVHRIAINDPGTPFFNDDFRPEVSSSNLPAGGSSTQPLYEEDEEETTAEGTAGGETDGGGEAEHDHDNNSTYSAYSAMPINVDTKKRKWEGEEEWDEEE